MLIFFPTPHSQELAVAPYHDLYPLTVNYNNLQNVQFYGPAFHLA